MGDAEQCRERVPLRSPVDIETVVVTDEDGREHSCVRATMERERSQGPVTIVEELVWTGEDVTQYRRWCESGDGKRIERVETFDR